MAQRTDPRKRWFHGLPRWSARMLVLMFAVGALIIVIDLALMAGFALQAGGLPWGESTPARPTSEPEWTPTPTAMVTATQVVEPTLEPTATPTAVDQTTATPTTTSAPPGRIAWKVSSWAGRPTASKA